MQTQIQALLLSPGNNEMEVRSEYNAETQTFNGVAIPNWDSDCRLFMADRTGYLNGLAKAMEARIPLREGVHSWVSVILGRRDWPMDPNVDDQGNPELPHPLDSYGVTEISKLCKHFEKFLKEKYNLQSMANITTDVQTDWATMKALVKLDYETKKKMEDCTSCMCTSCGSGL